GAPQRNALCTEPIANADRVALYGCNDQCQSKLRIDKDRLSENTQQGKAPAIPRKGPELVAVTVVGRGGPRGEGWRVAVEVRGLEQVIARDDLPTVARAVVGQQRRQPSPVAQGRVEVSPGKFDAAGIEDPGGIGLGTHGPPQPIG